MAGSKTCTPCSGKGSTSKPTSQKIDIPPGCGHLHTDSSISYSGLGSTHNSTRGRLTLVIKVLNPLEYTQDMLHLYYTAKISMTDLLLGSTQKITLPDDTIKEVVIPECSSPNFVVVERGKGMPSPNHAARGDLLISFEIVSPSRLSTEQRRSLENCRKAGL
jgi:DnaJ-class molecular chaperone